MMKTGIYVIGSCITALIVYVIVRLSSMDVLFSIIPGWHTTLYPPDVAWVIATIIILALSLVVHLLFSAITKLLTSLWKKIRS